MTWLDELILMGILVRILNPEDESHIKAAFATRGARKGRLLKTRPKNPLDGAAWAGAMSSVCANNLGFMHLFCMEPEEKALFKRVSRWSDLHSVVYALNQYGQGTCEFNLWAIENHADVAIATFTKMAAQQNDIIMAKLAYA